MQKLQLVNPIIPLVESLPGGFAVGNQLTLIGTAPLHANRFSINLQCGPNVSPRSDVALHVTADFIKNAMVRNSIQNWAWGVEESLGGMPLVKGRPFQMDITCEPTRFVILLDRNSVFYMSHRMPIERISHLTIDGEVLLNEIRLSSSPSSMPFGGSAPPYTAAPPYPGSAPPYPGSAPPYYSGGASPYPIMPMGGATPYAQGIPYNQTQPNHQSRFGPMGNVLGAGVVGAAISAGSLRPKKIMKHQKKMAKKALKYGVPIAGAGVGAYALGKALHHPHHHHHHHGKSSSSSSSSSSSD